jgi:hypothetical protein
MRFMMLMYPGPNAETGVMPDEKLIGAMMKYNEELAKAGALLALDGLQASSKGARVHFAKGKTSVTDGPFTEAKELVGGYWLIEAKSKEVAVEWARRAPCPDGEMIEVRQVFEAADFGPEVAREEAALAAEIGKRLEENKNRAKP